MYKFSFLLVVIFLQTEIIASDLQITNFSFTGNPRDNNPTLYVYFTVTWNNSWKNEKNQDGAWVFFKLRHQNDLRTHRHAYVKTSGHHLVYNYLQNNIAPQFYVPPHQAGIMIFPTQRFRGNISWRLKVELDVALLKGVDFPNNTIFGDVFGIEMVQIPWGSFYAGDSDTSMQNRESTFYQYANKARYHVNSEKAIVIGKENSSLYYDNRNVTEYRGDMLGPITDSFPKGLNEFYIMKYELTQGQYTSFLNTLSNQPSFFRSNFGGKLYYQERGSIRLENGRYITSHPMQPANYISWDDGCAFADWAGLRPMSELEYEKAARGPLNTLSKDYPWGTSSSEKVSRYYNQEGELVFEKGIAEENLDNTNLEFFGASYYWVMDLAGSLWERVATVGSSKGRLFKGTHGDGMPDQFGNATNLDWPNENEGGFGYRGGGYYGFGMALGPSHSTIGSRPFGSWGDGPRSVAYGFRGVLSVH
ncbi:MAG: formylglycine-generating enzyme family protein [Chitinophagaceae bacterium]